MELIDRKIKKIKSLCHKHKVSKLFVFGSVLTPEFSEQSDIDLLVDFDKVDLMDYADNYFGLKYALENIFGRSVDLLENQAIKNPFLKASIDKSKVLIYE